ncbi:MAG: hypothetical protein ACI9YP_001277, partial [Colwellia sp.]
MDVMIALIFSTTAKYHHSCFPPGRYILIIITT